MPLSGLTVSYPANPSPVPYVYMPAGWDTSWRAAKAAAGSTPTWITCLGDSIANGFNASDPMVNGFFEIVRTNLLARGYSTYGDYYGNYAYGTDNITSYTTTPPWGAYAGGGSKNLDNSPYHKYYNNAAFPAAWYQTFTTPYACTAFDILWWDQYAGTWQYRIDGGAGVTVTDAASGTQGSVLMKRISVTSLSNTTHTVDIGQSSAVGNVGCPGIAIYKPGVTGGIGFARWQYNGAKLSDYAGYGSAGWPSTKLRLVGGIRPQSSGATTNLTGFGFPTEPGLLMIALGINDANAKATDILQYEQGLNTLISGYRDSYPTGSVLLIAVCGPDAYSSDCNPAGFTLTSYAAYVGAMARVAQRRVCGFIDFDAKWGQQPHAAGFMSTNAIHPTTAGHSDMATTILTYI